MTWFETFVLQMLLNWYNAYIAFTPADQIIIEWIIPSHHSNWGADRLIQRLRWLLFFGSKHLWIGILFESFINFPFIDWYKTDIPSCSTYPTMSELISGLNHSSSWCSSIGVVSISLSDLQILSYVNEYLVRIIHQFATHKPMRCLHILLLHTLDY